MTVIDRGIKSFNMQNEIWKPVRGYEGRYEVSDIGSIRSLDFTFKSPRNRNKLCIHKGRMLRLHDNGRGYKTIMLRKDGQSKRHYIHRIVLESFIDNPRNLPQVNHINLDKSFNALCNLEWCSRMDNIRHAIKNGRKSKGNIKIGQDNPKSKLVLDMSNGIFYYSATEASKILGYKNTTLRCMLNGHMKNKTTLRYV